jgi:hypothetical protein
VEGALSDGAERLYSGSDSWREEDEPETAQRKGDSVRPDVWRLEGLEPATLSLGKRTGRKQ